MAYADCFLVPVPTKNLDTYKKVSTLAGKIWMEHGALDYKECVGDDLKVKGMPTFFPDAAGVKKGESVVFSWIVYKNKSERDRILKIVMADPRLRMPENSPFDAKRMYYGGFDIFVDMAPTGARAKKKAPPKKTSAKKKAKR